MRWLRLRFFGRQGISLAALCMVLVVALPAAAQDNTPSRERDPQSLAARLLGHRGPAQPVLTPLYDVGDTLEFWVGKASAAQPTKVTATLAAATPNIYLWVEEGLAYDTALMSQLAGYLHGIWNTIRSRATYATGEQAYPSDRVFDPRYVLPIPDSDNDPHLYILFTTDLMADRDAIINPNDSLPVALSPRGYGNQHETILVNTSAFPDVQLSDPVFAGMITRGLSNLIAAHTTPEQPPWLREMLEFYMLLRLQQSRVSAAEAAPFLAAPETPLLMPANLTTRSQTLGGQLLFIAYLEQRYGPRLPLQLFQEEGAGMAPLDRALAALNITDPVTGAPITGDDAFADFAMANALNLFIGDGRYMHQLVQLQPGQRAVPATSQPATSLHLSGQAVPQYGTVYAHGQGTAVGGPITVHFDGVETLPRLPLPEDAGPDNRFYWSGRARNRDHTMTRAVDLSDVDEATLRFDAWFDLSDGWDYGYVEVSTDGGRTWDLVPTTDRSRNNRNGIAYGPGFTGVSNPEGPRPFPALDVRIEPDGMTLNEVLPGGPAHEAGLVAGDRIIGYDGQPWEDAPNILGLLGEHAPGDEVEFLIERGGERLTVPVLLGAHETRVVEPEPLWLRQQADLSPYAGQEILLRFEYVSLPDRFSEGFAVDNIAVPEIGLLDDAEGENEWAMQGWERVDNRVSADYLVQAATTGTAGRPGRVLRLLNPGEGPNGEWTVELDAGESLIVAVSGMNENTYAPSAFDLRLTRPPASE